MKQKQAYGRSKHSDEVVLGPEPSSLGTKFTESDLGMAYNWYSYFYEVRNVRSWIIDWIKSNPQLFPPNTSSKFLKVNTDHIPLWLCVNCRLLTSNCPLPPYYIEKTRKKVSALVEPLTVVPVVVEPPALKRASPVILSDLEAILDRFYLEDYVYFDPGIYDLFTKEGVKQSDATFIHDYYQPLREEVVVGLGYERLSRKQKKAYLSFLDKILEETKLYAQNKRKVTKVRKPRKKKLKTADQLSAKVKFKSDDQTLQLVSVLPSTIVGSQVAWLFNTKQRNLVYLEAEKNGQLSINGTAVIGFNTKTSKAKKIRKPENLKNMVTGTKTSMIKEFEALTTTGYEANGRIGPDTIILKIHR